MNVFICSTRSDLREERDAVHEVIIGLGCKPVRMEDFGARPEPPIEVCLAEVRDCQAVVVIISHRAGARVPGSEYTYCNAEHEAAVRLGIPCYVYIRDDDAAVPGKYVENDPEGLRSLNEFKAKVAGRHTTCAFTDSANLAARVKADLERDMEKLLRKRVGPVPEMADDAARIMAEHIGRRGMWQFGRGLLEISDTPLVLREASKATGVVTETTTSPSSGATASRSYLE